MSSINSLTYLNETHVAEVVGPNEILWGYTERASKWHRCVVFVGLCGVMQTETTEDV